MKSSNVLNVLLAAMARNASCSTLQSSNQRCQLPLSTDCLILFCRIFLSLYARNTDCLENSTYKKTVKLRRKWFAIVKMRNEHARK
jgi:hypothetical protein